jgi:hypothetical protein
VAKAAKKRTMSKPFTILVLGLLAGSACTGLAYAEVLISPPANTHVYCGRSVPLTVDSTLADSDLDVRILVVWEGHGLASGYVEKTGAKPVALEAPVPKYTGPVQYEVGVRGLASGTVERHTHTLIAVPDPADTLTKFYLTGDTLVFGLNMSPDQPKPYGQLWVSGVYASGTECPLRRGVTGTVYRSSDTRIVTVDADGRVTGEGPGHAVITVEHGEHRAYALAHVQDPTTGREPVTDVTQAVAVTRGGFRKDPATGEYTQQLTLTNTSPQSIASPLKLVLSSLDPAIELRNSELTVRYTDNIEPVESPYYSVKLGAHNVLLPGEQIYFTARFRNPQNIPITYDARVYVGSDL